jgi:hypothetical protein
MGWYCSGLPSSACVAKKEMVRKKLIRRFVAQKVQSVFFVPFGNVFGDTIARKVVGKGCADELIKGRHIGRRRFQVVVLAKKLCVRAKTTEGGLCVRLSTIMMQRCFSFITQRCFIPVLYVGRHTRKKRTPT